MRKTILLCLLVFMLAACGADAKTSIPYSKIPKDGDAARGAELFDETINGAPQCTSCHTEDDDAASPQLAGFGAVAGERVEDESAREYAFYSIAEPSRHIVEGYGNAMYNQYDEKLTPQQIADLIAYLLEQ